MSASTISEHLTRLVDAGLLTAQREGRSRFFRLAGPDVAEALEAIARIAPPEPVRSLRQGTHAHALRRARTCYNHLAGRLGVALMAACSIAGCWRRRRAAPSGMRPTATACRRPEEPSTTGSPLAERRQLAAFGLDLEEVMLHRPAIRYCLDWSEQCHHLGGPLGTALRPIGSSSWTGSAAGAGVLCCSPPRENAGSNDRFGVALDA